MKKTFVSSIAVAAALLLLVAPAALAQYPPDGPGIATSTSVARIGDPVTVVATGFRPGSTVTFTLFSHPIRLGTDQADADGRATLTFIVPAHAGPGQHTIVAEGVDPDGDPLRLSTSLTVIGAATGQPTPPAPGAPGTPGDPGAPGTPAAPGEAGTDSGADTEAGDATRDAAGDSLPRTGGDIMGLVLTGLGLIAAGSGAVFLARKRLSARSA